MRPTRLGLLSAVIMAAVAMAGCSGGNDSAGDAAKSGSGNAAAKSTSTSAAPSGAAAAGADTKTDCTAINGDIDSAMAKVAEAEKIGPPAGHSAVSAQYSAGAATLYVHTFSPNTKVNDAVKQVANAMSDLADKFATAPKEAPSKATLDTAVKQVKAACGTN